MKIDARNMECPKPVLMTKEAIESLGDEGSFEILLNTEISKENVLRFLKQNGVEASVKTLDNGEFVVTGVKGYACEAAAAKNGSKIVFVKTDYIGESGELGTKLIKGFLSAMVHVSQKPSKIIFVNRGVMLTTKDENSDVIAALKELEKCGVTVLSCGACLEFYGLAGDLKVGAAGNALDTVESLLSSDSVVSL